jgi:polyribonucleotide nucleotidyltransferase
MVEAGANFIPEAEILDALDIAHEEIRKLCALQRELAEKAGKPKLTVEAPQVDEGLLEQIRSSHGAQLDEATQVADKLERQAATKAVEEAVLTQYSGDAESETFGEYRQKAQLAFDRLEKEIIRRRIAVEKKRPDGRAADEIRPISIEAGVLPRGHGSALFTRGQTQALSAVALGTLKEEMRLDTLGLETQKFYWHHYNFPPFSVGEAGFMRGPKRRDIGHGALAERALVPVVPTTDEFPYTIRVVSDILESNGSSSMASVCGSTLSLMDAGVPIKDSVAGIAMGLIKEGDDYVVLTDIAGVEDHLGDMDFKVAGTREGITALQMDIKISGVTFEILRDALAQAREARLNILGQMADVIDAPRPSLSPHAPRILTVQIDPDKIGLLIGKGGETIRGLSDEFESQIDVNDEGQVLIYSANGELGEALAERIRTMTKEVEVGDEYAGKVVKTTTFGAFVELAKGTDGLLHISNVSPGQRVDAVEDVLNKGDEIRVRVVEVDRERGRIGLRLAEDPEIAGKSAADLAGVGTGGGGGPRVRRDGGPRRDGGGRDRDAGPRGSGRPRHRSGAGRDPERG